MSRIPWWGWAAAFIVVGYVFAKWYANQSANTTANAYLNPSASQVPFDNAVPSDLSTATVEDLIQYEQQIQAGAAKTATQNPAPASTPPQWQPMVLLPGAGGGLVKVA